MRIAALAIGGLLFAAGCNNNNSTSSGNAPITPGNNALTITVNSGPTGNYINGAFTSVTVCVPGTTSCQSIDGMLVDTGSSGVRVLSSVLTLSLPAVTASNGSPLLECNQFVDGFTWGPVQTADIKIAGEQASRVPIQVIGTSAFSTIPSSCSSSGGSSEDTLDTLGAKGVLGIGVFRQDCGSGCTFSGSSNPGVYYTCSGSNCQVATVPLAQQLQNPVWLFAGDNNGTVIQLPTASSSGQVTLSGALAFGIGTQSNNGLGSAQVLTLDQTGSFTTVFRGQSYDRSFIDTGSNGTFFLNSSATGLPTCTTAKDFYCPSTLQMLSATNRGANGRTTTIDFSVDNAETLLNNQTFNVFPTIAGPNPGSFDWGLPFYYGRTVFTAIEGQSTSGGTGPYVAY